MPFIVSQVESEDRGRKSRALRPEGCIETIRVSKIPIYLADHTEANLVSLFPAEPYQYQLSLAIYVSHKSDPLGLFVRV